MTRGRPNKGVEHVDGLEGGAQEKRRLQAILATFTGEMSVEEASRILGVSETRFGELRIKALQGALFGLAPRPVGRPVFEEEPGMDPICRDLMEKLERAEAERKVMKELYDLGMAGPGESREKGGGEKREGRRKRRKHH